MLGLVRCRTMNEDFWPSRRLHRGGNSSNLTTEVTYTEDMVSKWLWKTVAPCLLLIGTTGNSYVIVMMFRLRHRMNKCIRFNLLMLSFTDIVILITALGRVWLDYMFNVDIRTISDVSCKLHVFVQYTFTSMSSWILVSYNLEMFISVAFAFYGRSWNTVRKARLRLLLVFICLACLNCFSFWTVGLRTDGSITNCQSNSIGIDVYRVDVYVWVYMIFMSLLPFTILTLLNSLIIRTVIHSKLLDGAKHGGREGKGDRRLHRLPLTTTFFLVSTFPSAVVVVTNSYTWSEWDERVQARLYLAWSIVALLHYTNPAFNFVIYTFHKVREEQQKRELSKRRSQMSRSFATVSQRSELPPAPHHPQRPLHAYRHRYLPKVTLKATKLSMFPLSGKPNPQHCTDAAVQEHYDEGV
ncbi:G-protein coupled estrogen receptor 1-like [Haliotis cracherodii]|uniref:G-protein coupled estrogen receptor 1-like n=1 Tax=Haliotis cracherodii TaxID=6455 RepID=UPI0039E76C14